jgi:hypothetical protein
MVQRSILTPRAMVIKLSNVGNKGYTAQIYVPASISKFVSGKHEG